jgi:hypothetical protein
VLERVAEEQGEPGDGGRDPELDRPGHPQRPPDRKPALAALRDRPREELLDRPVDNRDGHDHGRPEDDDLPVLLPREVVRGEREVEVGEEPGDADPGGEQDRAAPVSPGFGSRVRHRRGTLLPGCAAGVE